MEHQVEMHKDCMIPNCELCKRGLFYCTVCNATEESLHTECTGEKHITATEVVRRKKIMNAEYDKLQDELTHSLVNGICAAIVPIIKQLNK